MCLLYGDHFIVDFMVSVLKELAMRRCILCGADTCLGRFQSITDQHPQKEDHTLNLTNVCDPTLYAGSVCVYVCVYKYIRAHDHMCV